MITKLITDDGSGALRVRRYYTHSSNAGINRSIYHSSKFAAMTDVEWDTVRAEAIKATEAKAEEAKSLAAETAALSESRSRDNDKIDIMNKDERKNGRLPYNLQCWINKDAMTNKQVTDSVDSCIHDILQGVQAQHYIGILSPRTIQAYIVHKGSDEEEPIYAAPNFRKAIAKSRPYKGKRPERPDWYLKWCPIIENHLEEVWGFIRTPEGYEADDLVATLMTELSSVQARPICCGNDKDLLQIPGEHFNVVKKTIQTLDWYQCGYKLATQWLTGDTTDNICGVEGLGPKGAEKILALCVPSNSELTYAQAVLKAYTSKYGDDQGVQKFYENYMLVKLRTDVPTEQFELQEICRGYDLAKYELEQFTENHAEDYIEEIPDFTIKEKKDE
ncbi:unnamed protein product [Sphagnum balticum]